MSSFPQDYRNMHDKDKEQEFYKKDIMRKKEMLKMRHSINA